MERKLLESVIIVTVKHCYINVFILKKMNLQLPFSEQNISTHFAVDAIAPG